MLIPFTKIVFWNHFFKSLFFFILISFINSKSLIFFLQPIDFSLFKIKHLTYRLAKNPRKQFRKIKKFKNIFKTNRYTGRIKLKFSNFFYFVEKKTPRNSFLNNFNKPLFLTNKKFYKNHTNFFFFLYRQFFLKRWFPLTGFAISKQASTLQEKKKWLQKNLKIRLRRNYKYYKQNRSKNLSRFKIKKFPKKKKPKKKLNKKNAPKKSITEIYMYKKQMYKKKVSQLRYVTKNRLKFIYYNNLFYFIKTKISYRRLKYFMKIIRAKFPVNARRNVFHQSYLFLNNVETYFKKANYPLKHIRKLFKLHKRLFRILKRRNSWTRKWAHVWFKSYSNTNRIPNKQLITFGPKLNIKQTLRHFFNSNLIIVQTKNHLRIHSCLSFFVRWKKTRKWLKKYMKRRWRQFFLGQPTRRSRKRIIYRKLKKLFRRYSSQIKQIHKRLYSSRFVNKQIFIKIRKKFRYHRGERWYNWRLTRRFKRWFFWIRFNKKLIQSKHSALPKYSYYKFYNNRQFTQKITTFNLLNTKLTQLKIFFWSRSLKKTKMHIFTFFRSTNKIKRYVSLKYLQPAVIQSAVYTLLKKPIITPVHRTNFTLRVTGFMLLTNTLFLNYNNKNKQKVYLIKKKMYSFSYKSDMRKHLLKKATRWRRSSVLVTYFRKRRALRWKKFYNPIYKELHLSTKRVSFSFNSPISNLHSMLTRRFCSSASSSINQYFKRKKFGVKRARLKIPKIKFKASSTWWRRSRRALTQSLTLKFRYQHRLTKFIVNYKNIIHTKFLPIFEMRLFNILIRTRFVLDQTTAFKFIDNRLIFINGVCCSNRNLQIFTNDFLQLIVTFKYYIVFRWLLNYALRMKKRIKHVSWKNKQRKRTEGKQWNRHLQRFVLPHKYLTLDIAKYLEVDFFTLSAFILYDPFLWNDLNRNNIINVKYGIINVYNWKYIT